MFIVFAYNHYYPAGGPHDIELVTDDFEEAKEKAHNLRNGLNDECQSDYAEVYDVREKRVVISY
jgi:hypothetical protein